jgi:hypothetical protein
MAIKLGQNPPVNIPLTDYSYFGDRHAIEMATLDSDFITLLKQNTKNDPVKIRILSLSRPPIDIDLLHRDSEQLKAVSYMWQDVVRNKTTLTPN